MWSHFSAFLLAVLLFWEPRSTDSVLSMFNYIREPLPKFGTVLGVTVDEFDDSKQVPAISSDLAASCCLIPPFFLQSIFKLHSIWDSFHELCANELAIITSNCSYPQIEKLSLDSSFAEQQRDSLENHLPTPFIQNHHWLNFSKGEGRAVYSSLVTWDLWKLGTSYSL